MHIPVRTFQGYVRSIRSDDLNEVGRKVLAQAFPRFFASRSEEQMASEIAFARQHKLDALLLDGTARRFAGEDSLPRSRYFSIADHHGSDRGTLLRELLAYSTPRYPADRYWVVDLAWPEQFAPLVAQGFPFSGPRSALAVFPLAAFRPETYVRLAEHGSQLNDEERRACTTLPTRTEQIELTRCLDMRRPDVQSWLFETFHRGVPGMYNRPRGTNAKSFFHILPSLMWPAIGGGDVKSPGAFNRVLGSILRDEAVDALIFPSARSDVGVTVRDGVVEDCYGWNLVMYGGATTAIRSKGAAHGVTVKQLWSDHSAWTGFPYPVRIQIANGTPHNDGSWKISGVEKAQLSTISEAWDMQ